MDRKWEVSNKKLYIVLTIFTLIFFCRIINIDCDLPPWGMINYQPMDEGQYATMAINRIEYGTIKPDTDIPQVDFLTSAHIRNNFFGNTIIYIGLVLFGDNYLGLRSSSVLMGAINYGLFLLICLTLKHRYNRGKEENANKYLVLFAAIMLFDFSFLMASRVVETTIYRMFFMQLIVFLFISDYGEEYREKYRFLLIGFLTVYSIFQVYITNIYIFFALLLTIFYIGLKKGKRFFYDSMVYYAAGCGVAYLVCEWHYYSVWGSSCIQNTMQIIRDFAGTAGYNSGAGIAAFILVLIKYVSTNSNLYNLALLFLFLMSIPFLITHTKKHKDEDVFFLFMILLSMFLQTFITEDYIVRKGIMLFPICLYLLFISIISKKEETKKISKIYVVISIVLCILVIAYRLMFALDGTSLDFPVVDKIIIGITLLIIIIASFFYKNNKKNRSYLVFDSLICICLVLNIYMDIKYVVLNQSYTEKETMIEIGEHLDGNYVYGIYSISFTLYNNFKPVVNTYEKINNQIGWTDNQWYLDYSDYNFDTSDLLNGEVQLYESYKYERNFSTFGTCRGVSLYEIK